MTKQILAFLFCFTRELNLYPPLTLSLPSARELKTYTPLLPSLSAHLSTLKTLVFIKPLVLPSLTSCPQPHTPPLSLSLSFHQKIPGTHVSPHSSQCDSSNFVCCKHHPPFFVHMSICPSMSTPTGMFFPWQKFSIVSVLVCLLHK